VDQTDLAPQTVAVGVDVGNDADPHPRLQPLIERAGGGGLLLRKLDGQLDRQITKCNGTINGTPRGCSWELHV
jgi:hypothetical protein